MDQATSKTAGKTQKDLVSTFVAPFLSCTVTCDLHYVNFVNNKKRL